MLEYVLIVGAVLGLVTPAAAQGGCPNTAGVAIGSVLATLAVVGVILLIIYLLKRRKDKKKALGMYSIIVMLLISCRNCYFREQQIEIHPYQKLGGCCQPSVKTTETSVILG